MAMEIVEEARPVGQFVGAEENQMGNSSEEPSFTDALGVMRFVFDASAKFASIPE
jgi:hypothetical protein